MSFPAKGFRRGGSLTLQGVTAVTALEEASMKVVIELEDGVHDPASFLVRVRRWQKCALRSYGLKVLRTEEESTPPPSDVECSSRPGADEATMAGRNT